MSRERCKKEVRNRDYVMNRYTQCSRYAVKDGYCKQHHPDAVKKRKEEKDARFHKQQENAPWKLKQKIAELQAENKKLRDALEDVIEAWSIEGATRIAQKALKKEGE